MKVKKIVATCPAGLGNRIKCLVSTLKQCSDYIDKGIDVKPYVYWPSKDDNKYGYGRFKEYFKYPNLFKEINKHKLDALEVDAYHGEVEFNKSWKFESSTSTDKSDNANADLDFKYHNLKKSDINKFLPYFKFIEPSQDIQDTVWAFMNKYKKSFDKGEVIGVHIRNSKNYKISFDGRQHISKEDDFIKRIRCLLEINLNYKFLLCTEDKKTEDKFKLLFNDEINKKETIIYFPKKFRGKDSSNFIKEAFVDMLLLSKCPIILGSFLSTFTEVAWWFGGCKAQVYIPGTEDKEAVNKVLAQLPKKGEGIHKKVWRRIKILWKERK